jgi:hypothetical protein
MPRTRQVAQPRTAILKEKRSASREFIAHIVARLTAITVRAGCHQAPGRILVRRPAVCSHPPAR